MNRRLFNRQLLQALSSYALLESLVLTSAFSPSIKPITTHWVNRLHEYCGDLKRNALAPGEWQSQVESLLESLPLEDLLQFIDFEKLIRHFEYPDLGVATRPVRFPKLKGLPERTHFVKKIFGMKKDRAIIPHGHANMVSAHLVLQGEMHLRHYDKIASDNKHLIITPTIDRQIKPGESSSISDERDNIHWFVATTNHAFTFDVILLDLNEQPYDIYNLDIDEQQDLHNGHLRVPILEVETALKKYGKQHH